MTTLVEGNLQIVFPPPVAARKFDDRESHGLSHCMKAVDFIAEETDRVSFIEIKDPEHPRTDRKNREKFTAEFLSGALDEDLKYKCRDTFLYQWAAGNVNKPVYYWVIVALNDLTAGSLVARTNELRRKLPVKGPPSVKWTRPIITDCMVFNIAAWKRYHKRFPLSRIP